MVNKNDMKKMIVTKMFSIFANEQANTELVVKIKKTTHQSPIWRYLEYKISDTEQREVLCKKI